MLSKHSFFFLKPAVSRKEKSIRKRWDRRSGRRSSGLLGPTNRPSAECRAAVEELEDRWLLSATLANLAIPAAHPTYVILGKQPDAKSAQLVGNFESPITPGEMRAAYGISSLNIGAVSSLGSGQTIALVDAYADSEHYLRRKHVQQRLRLAAIQRDRRADAHRAQSKWRNKSFGHPQRTGNRLGHRGIARRRMGPQHGSRSQHHPVRSQQSRQRPLHGRSQRSERDRCFGRFQ